MVEPHREDDEKSRKGLSGALEDKKKKKLLEELAEDQTRTKVITWKSTTNR